MYTVGEGRELLVKLLVILALGKFIYEVTKARKGLALYRRTNARKALTKCVKAGDIELDFGDRI